MEKITNKWLIKKKACPKGIKWFKRNYPDGLVITKRNMGVLIDKLLRRKKVFYFKNIKQDTSTSLRWLLDNIVDGFVYMDVYCITTKDITSKILLNAFWKEYKDATK